MLVGALIVASTQAGCRVKPRDDYTEARAQFKTRLAHDEPAPQDFTPSAPPAGAREIPYTSAGLALKAWVSVAPADGVRRPAVLFLHGGFACDREDWVMSQPYRDAGFVVLTPMLRGENGLPGSYSMFFHEVDDVLAAADALAALPYVQADRINVAGHSVGGTLALLAAMSTRRFRAAASFEGSPDQKEWAAGQAGVIPFDPSDSDELRIRSPLAFATSFKIPVRAYYATSGGFGSSTKKLAAYAQEKGLDVEAIEVPGDHETHVPEAIRKSIAFLRSKE